MEERLARYLNDASDLFATSHTSATHVGSLWINFRNVGFNELAVGQATDCKDNRFVKCCAEHSVCNSFLRVHTFHWNKFCLSQGNQSVAISAEDIFVPFKSSVIKSFKCRFKMARSRKVRVESEAKTFYGRFRMRIVCTLVGNVVWGQGSDGAPHRFHGVTLWGINDRKNLADFCDRETPHVYECINELHTVKMFRAVLGAGRTSRTPSLQHPLA
ncbi:hypothetical protein FB466_0918 [Klugiella xanthotipulae]|uniref:Uncharacterized protein n=1 Tax=Klugiella xanthotipulae TaxID=244735 RepID=A0A543I669_9MICO|nr:hypothetical protein FB466_0918 [Klugiella xanthotipulae]